MPKQHVELTDGNVILRPFELSDAEALFEKRRREEKYLPVLPDPDKRVSLESIRQRIVSALDCWDRRGPELVFGIWFRKRLVGWIKIDTNNQKHEWLKKGETLMETMTFSGTEYRMYEAESVNLALDFLKRKGFTSVLFVVKPSRVSSLIVPSVCGFDERVEQKGSNSKNFVFLKYLQEA